MLLNDYDYVNMRNLDIKKKKKSKPGKTWFQY